MHGNTRFGRALTMIALGLLVAAVAPLPAQEADSLSGPAWSPLLLPGSPLEDRLRVAQLRGAEPTAGFLLRTPSSRAAPPRDGALRWSLVAPLATVTHNSRLPFSLNDGALWSGRGVNARVAAGVRVSADRFSLTLAPELVYSQNLRVRTFAPADDGMSVYASRWYVDANSADLPQRLGDAPLLSLRPGQSVLEAELGPVRAGASTENQWWGPGARNALLMSSNAEGVPHLFLRTARPLRTPLGDVEARWIVGGLAESLYFDTIAANDVRSLSGFVATFTPAGEPGLTLGLARVVYARVSGAGAVPGRAFDALTWWDRPSLEADSAGGPESRDQIVSLFGRWVLPDDGFELYAEWARAALPASFRDLVNQPNHTQGYTLGLQWARPARGDDLVRVQSEVTYLEESPASLTRPGKSFYVSESIVQGYTQRGKPVGAAIGPGASSQWLAVDYLAPGWRAGAFGGRIRWDNDVYYDPGRISYVAHDVSLFGGLRAGGRLLDSHVLAEFTRGIRYNYRFQNPENNPWGRGAVDVWNTTLRLTITPFLSGRP